MIRALALAVPLVAVAGCALVTEDDGSSPPRDPGAEGGEPGDGVSGPIPTNGLALDLDVVAASFSTAPLSSWAAAMAPDPVGDEHLRYLALCALGPDQTLGDHRGFYELAPEWADSTCDDACQAWVSACLMAHTNLEGQHVQISARGMHPGLAEPTAAFTTQEASFYGDLFVEDEAPRMFACSSGDLSTLDVRITASYMRGRLCGVGHCPFSYTGLCSGDVVPDELIADELTSGAFACLTDLGDRGFTDCRMAESPGSTTADTAAEVVTVYVAP